MGFKATFGLHPDWKVAIGLAGAGAVTVAPVGTFAWWAGWLLLAGGIFWLISIITHDGKPWWQTYRRVGVGVGVAVCVLLVGGATLQFKARNPSLEDISIVFIPIQFDASRLNGSVTIRSKAERPITVTEVRIASSKGLATVGRPTNVRLDQPASFPFEQYFWRGGMISFEAHYSVNGKPSEKALHAEFQVSPNPKLGEEIFPTNCCESESSDFRALAASDAQRTANGPQGCLPMIVPEKLSDGKWQRVWDAHDRRIFVFDPVVRVARMGSFMRKKWHWIYTPLDETNDGIHNLRYCWHEANGYMAVEADGSYAIYDVDSGQIKRGDLR